MLSEPLSAVVAPTARPEPPRAVMWAIKAIADRDSISKQAVQRKVGKLAAEHGLTVERDAAGRVRAVNVAEYDRLRGRLDDPSKAQAPGRAANAVPAPADDAESYGEAARQTKWLEAERKRLDLDELKGELIRVAKVVAAIDGVGSEISRVIDRLPNMADELQAASERGGLRAVQAALKDIAYRQRVAIADAMKAIAESVPRQDADEAAPSAGLEAGPGPS